MNKYKTTTCIYTHPYSGAFEEIQDTVMARDENHAAELATKMNMILDRGLGISSSAVLIVEDSRSEIQRKIDFIEERLNFRECDRPAARTIRQWKASLAELKSQNA